MGSNAQSSDSYCSQIGQDKWVEATLKRKHCGTFLDVGCGHWQRISNTCYLESCLGWSGIGIDINGEFADGWKRNRTSVFIEADATSIDYDRLLDEHDMPDVIDYLSVDLEPPRLSLDALKKIMFGRRSFRCVTFETDAYRGPWNVGPSRELMYVLGYKLVVPGKQDDFWTKLD